MSDAASKVVLAAIDGQQLSASEREFFAQQEVAGVTLFRRNIASFYPDTVHLVSDLQSLRPAGSPPFIVAIDQEGGRVSRIAAPFPNHGPALQLAGGKCDENALQAIFEHAKDVSLTLLKLGINVNFAPVCDILTNPTNTAIGDRVFGTDPNTAALRAEAYLDGMRAGGLGGCLKHFPGQGDAGADTHLSSCRLEIPLDTLNSRELVPFKRLLYKSDMVMLSHCIYPAWDPAAPASLSRLIIQDVLKKQNQFRGLVVSDDMVMEAIDQNPGQWEQAVVTAIAAGVDLLLVCRDLDRIKRAIEVLRRTALENASFALRLESAAANVQTFREKLAHP